MNWSQAVMAASLLFIASQSYASDCKHLAYPSKAYYDCEVERDSRLNKKVKNLLAFNDVMETDELLGYGRNCDAVSDEETHTYMMRLCKQPVVILLAVDPSPFTQEFSGEIENKKLEAIFIGGLNVINKSKNYTLRRYPPKEAKYPTVVAIFIELNESPDMFNEIREIMRKKGLTEVSFKSEEKSTKLLLNAYR